MGIGAQQPQLLQWAGALQGAGVSFHANRVSVTLQGRWHVLDGVAQPSPQQRCPRLSPVASGVSLAPIFPCPNHNPPATLIRGLKGAGLGGRMVKTPADVVQHFSVYNPKRQQMFAERRKPVCSGHIETFRGESPDLTGGCQILPLPGGSQGR